MLDFENTRMMNTRLLSVSGGGLLGVIPAAILMRYEALGRTAYGADYRLCDSFDAVAGSSTGAVIAAGIALGLPAQDIANFYLRDVPRGFKRKRLALPLIHDIFDGDLMERFFEARTRGCLMERRALECDLTIMVKDLGRGTPLAFTTRKSPISNLLGAEICTEAQPLARVLRASTAAPGLFSPVEMALDRVGPTLLADGGFSLFNDPSYLASRLAMAQGATGIDLTVLGTGSARPPHKARIKRRGPSIGRALHALFGLIGEGEILSEALVTQLGGLPGFDMSVRRHDMRLTAETFETIGAPATRSELRDMRRFADFKGKVQLYEAATLLAKQTIHAPLPLKANRQMPNTHMIDTSELISAN
ncbi:patatin-like phospholipase family protein [uncultured Tateyamaria sp.]|uniref:patatin-like phospholipase family protein n=1 Tax=uncultured Tateyamaria sp. TaxID=455651 RepID=UPI00261384ED|nr:patatin-like phospholipase family protein [uncultured Tateyamaria sp.]